MISTIRSTISRRCRICTAAKSGGAIRSGCPATLRAARTTCVSFNSDRWSPESSRCHGSVRKSTLQATRRAERWIGIGLYKAIATERKGARKRDRLDAIFRCRSRASFPQQRQRHLKGMGWQLQQIIRLPKEGSFRHAQSLACNAGTRAFWRRSLATLARCSIRISRLCARTPAACGWRDAVCSSSAS